MLNRLLLAASLAALASPALAAPAKVSARAMAIHQRLMTLDTHLDTPAGIDSPRGFDITHRHDVMRDGSQVDLPRMKAGGLDGGFWVIYMPQGPLTPEGYAKIRDTALLRALSIRLMVAQHPDKFELALKADDAARIHAKGKAIVYMSMENSYELGDDITLMDTFYKLGVRMMSPAHNGTNQLTDSANPGALGNKWGGLSPMGKAFVKRANELGVVLDGSHASDDAIEQMIDLSSTPIVLSHHGAEVLNDHPRNLPDRLLKKMAAKGGVIHMNTLFLKTLPASPERTKALAALNAKYGGNPRNLTGPKAEAYLDEMQALNKAHPAPMADFEDYMAQILYCLKLLGPDHVGIGADWDGGGGVSGLNDVSDLPKITERLLKEGYTEADLAKIWSGNTLRVMRAVEAAAAK
jgi:membrane dipeptidase